MPPVHAHLPRSTTVAVVVLGALAMLLAALAPAFADPLPADYDGQTDGDVLALDVTALNAADVDATIGHALTQVDSEADPRADAESANVEAGAVGLGVSVNEDNASAGPDDESDTYDLALGEVDVAALLDTGIVTGTGSATWAGDAACVPDGDPIAEAQTEVAGITLGIPAVDILDVGTLSASGETTLDDGSVVSTSAGSIADLSLFDDGVTVDVVTEPEITATSDGTTGTATANDYAVEVTIGGTTTELTAGGSVDIDLAIGTVATVDATLEVGTFTDESSGATGAGSTTFLSLTGTIEALDGATLATLDLGILPLSASATAPVGGVECDALDPPVITDPSNGDTTGPEPTIAGTGVPGATVTVTEGGDEVGTAVVGDDGTWSFVPTNPLDDGEHTIVGTEELDGTVSGPSNEVTFTVADTTAPDAPVIESPADGEAITDPTPDVTGTGEPGATVDVTIDGDDVGSTTVDGDGNWTLPTTDELADGEHTVSATQTDDAGNTSEADSNTFTVDTSDDEDTTPPEPPVIESPDDGETVADDTPDVTGTGEPGATVDVTIDGDEVGSTTVDGDGNWTITVDEPLDDGDHTVVATQTDAAGNTSAPDQVTFAVDTGGDDGDGFEPGDDGDGFGAGNGGVALPRSGGSSSLSGGGGTTTFPATPGSPGTTSTGSNRSTLANTGSGGMPSLVLLAGSLLLAGWVLVRRRRHAGGQRPDVG